MNYEVAFYLSLSITITALVFTYIMWSVFFKVNRYTAERVIAAKQKAANYKARFEEQRDASMASSRKVGLLHNEVVRLNDASTEAAQTIEELTAALRSANTQIKRLTIKATIDSVREEVESNAESPID